MIEYKVNTLTGDRKKRSYFRKPLQFQSQGNIIIRLRYISALKRHSILSSIQLRVLAKWWRRQWNAKTIQCNVIITVLELWMRVQAVPYKGWNFAWRVLTLSSINLVLLAWSRVHVYHDVLLSSKLYYFWPWVTRVHEKVFPHVLLQ